MTEFRRLLEFWQDEADEAARAGYGVEIRLTHPRGLTETILRPARLREPLLTPRQREILSLSRGMTDDEAGRALGLTRQTVATVRWRCAMRLGCQNDRNEVIREAVRAGEIPPD